MTRKLIILAAGLSFTALAQDTLTLRQRSFPLSMPVEENAVEWKREIYREVSLEQRENEGLYCQQGQTSQPGLFTIIFNLAVEKKIPVYRYNIDGNESFEESAKVDIKDVLTNHHIYFEERNDSIIIDKDNVPASDVMLYYIKENVQYDMNNSSFRTKVTALCPVLVENDEFSTSTTTKYPFFWILYKDIEPYLRGVTIIPDYNNTAVRIPMSDYFTLNLYKGDIYKTANPRGFTLRQTAESDSVLKKKQEYVERQLKDTRQATYNTYQNTKK